MSQQFSERLELALKEYVAAHVVLAVHADNPEEVNQTGDALRSLINGEIDRFRDALRLVLPLAKGYAPEGQTPEAKRTCREWIAAAEAAINET